MISYVSSLVERGVTVKLLSKSEDIFQPSIDYFVRRDNFFDGDWADDLDSSLFTWLLSGLSNWKVEGRHTLSLIDRDALINNLSSTSNSYRIIVETNTWKPSISCVLDYRVFYDFELSSINFNERDIRRREKNKSIPNEIDDSFQSHSII